MAGRHEHVTYDLFLEAIKVMGGEGVKLSIRNVQNRIGGSNSKILEFMRRWQAENSLASSLNDKISDSLQQSLLAEFGRMVQGTRDHLTAQLTQLEQQLKEANELLTESEAKNAALEIEHQTEREQFAEKILTLEKKLAIAEQHVVDAQQQLAKEVTKCEEKLKVLEAKLVEVQEKAHQQELRAVASETKVAELEKHQVKNTSK